MTLNVSEMAKVTAIVTMASKPDFKVTIVFNVK